MTAHDEDQFAQFAPDPHNLGPKYEVAFQIGYLRASARLHRDDRMLAALRDLEAALQPLLDPRK